MSVFFWVSPISKKIVSFGIISPGAFVKPQWDRYELQIGSIFFFRKFFKKCFEAGINVLGVTPFSYGNTARGTKRLVGIKRLEDEIGCYHILEVPLLVACTFYFFLMSSMFILRIHIIFGQFRYLLELEDSSRLATNWHVSNFHCIIIYDVNNL